jgi:hypothetical protein
MKWFRAIACVLALWASAAAQTAMTVDQLFTFIRSSIQFIKDGTMTDKQLADYLGKSKLKEKLDDRSVEQIQALGIGPLTLNALRKLRDQSQALTAAKPVEPPPDPRLAPPPSSEEQAAMIDEVRKYALDYSKTLPDFICTQVTRRYAAIRPGLRGGGSANQEPSWQLLDTLTVRLSYFEQKEDYKLVLLNNAPTTQSYSALGGASVTGDFGSMMKEIFERASEARFEWDHWGTLRSRYAMVFAYRVTEARSQWHVVYNRTLEVVPAYRGLIYIDARTHELLRVTLSAVDLPADFPIRSAETILDYDYQDLSGHSFLLPLKAQTVMMDGQTVSRNDEEFRVYRKYTAESELKFDYPTPDALPEDQTKEAPPPAAPSKNQKTKKK